MDQHQRGTFAAYIIHVTKEEKATRHQEGYGLQE